MASTNKTPHLGLCQWEASDPFLREDMNGDFARIDEAFGNLPRVKLFDVTVSQAVPMIQLDFTDIDLTPYAELEMFFSFASDNKYMRMNGVSGDKYLFIGLGNYVNQIDICSGSSRIAIARDCFAHSGTATPRSTRMKAADFPQLNTIELFSLKQEFNFAKDDTVSVWGVRR